MRLLHVHSGNLYGGVESMMLTLARESARTAKIAHEFAIAFDGRIACELRSAGVPVHLMGSVRVRNPLSAWRARRRLKRLLKAQRFDAVICHMPWNHAIFAGVVRRARRPLVFWMHGATTGRHWTELWAALTPPDLALCNSRFTASMLPLIFPRVPPHVIYCPVAIPDERPIRSRALELRDELATARDAVVIVQVGRMESLKGHAALLHALAPLRDRNWICWQAGAAQRPHERAYVDGLRRLADELGIGDRVKFLGHRSDVARVLAAADIYCQPNSAPDAFGLSFIEALGAGLPVVTTAIGGAIEIVDETCGVLVAPDDKAALAGALGRLIDDIDFRHRLGAAGPARAKALCDPPAILREIASLIEELH